MKTQGDEAKCADLSSPGYTFKSFPRATRGGGLAVVTREGLPVTVSVSFPFGHTSFELVQVTLTVPQHIHFFCLYRPPPSKRNDFTESVFLNEFPGFLEHCNLLRGKLIILGDFNIRFDCPSNSITSKTLEILSAFNVVMAVKESTHIREHILDWAMYREDERIFRSCTVGYNISSDHFPILCYLNITKSRQQPAFRVSRNTHTICRPDFKADIAASVASLSEPTAARLNEQLRSLLDRHAPAARRKVLIRRQSPWYADVCEELRATKRQRRRAERRWMRSGLTMDKQVYTAAKRAVSKIVHGAKSKYLSSEITESNSGKQLYHVSNKFLSGAKASPLPTVHPSDQ